MASNLEIGFELDRLWHLLRGENEDMDETKKPALCVLAQIFDDEEIPYAVIGGVAMQIRGPDPRTTLDIDIAIVDRARIPRARLTAAGFVETGTFPYTVNFKGPSGTAVQFSDDPTFHEAIARAGEVDLEDRKLKVIQTIDLLRSKLRSASEPKRRRSKKIRDIADVEELLEVEPSLRGELTSDERQLLELLYKI